MRIDAIGAGSTAGLEAWADLLAANRIGASGIERMMSVASADGSMSGLLGAVVDTGLSPATQVQLSEAAVGLFPTDAQGGDSTFGEIAQALMVALILQLLDAGGGTA